MPGTPAASVVPSEVSRITGYGSYHHPKSHWYFKCKNSLTVKELAKKLGLEGEPAVSPVASRLFIDTGPPEGKWELAYVVYHDEDVCVFAVSMCAPKSILHSALEFAQPHWPFGDTIT